MAMMVVCARVERTLTRAWTFTPEKAEVVDMIAAILMLRAVDGTVRFGCWWRSPDKPGAPRCTGKTLRTRNMDFACQLFEITGESRSTPIEIPSMNAPKRPVARVKFHR